VTMRRGKVHVRGRRTGQILFGIAAAGAAIVLVRSLPDLIRYLRARNM
jgi:hypothetical protein